MLRMGKGEKDEQIFSDLELIRRCSEGEVRAQELLYRRYFSFAMSVAVRYTGDENEAMEIVNDSFMKVLEKSGEFDSTRPFRPWYGKILVNSAIDNYRKNTKYPSHLQISDIEATEEQEPGIYAELSAGDILGLFRQLPEKYRITFNLFEVEGYSHDEIAKQLDITASTSRSNLTRARKMLRELYMKNFNPAKRNNGTV
jgi:RNA polymerase sigma-70 factor (ECF subfamily)